MVYSRRLVSDNFFAWLKEVASLPVMELVKQALTCFRSKGHEHWLQEALWPKVLVHQAITAEQHFRVP